MTCGIANVLAMREMIAAGYRITMDTDFDNAFVVHCDGDREMRFVNCKGVYVLEQLGADVEPGAKETSAMYRCQAAAEGVTSVKFFDKKRDLETFQDDDQITGVDDTEQGYLEEAFDQDYEPNFEDECDFNLHGQFDDIDDSERNELLADADNDVDDMPELTVRFQGDDDYESDDNN
ncbi:unnamed protein product [Cylindrotheca closterium]|uniref:Uncharacterized protein n=1 Tax=Cylindrotheca closterium TaxID=2856 RepID=A0AAD2FC17_9STRA|nr:unnamed protein product [Cylindrotheca closterium]